MKNLLKILSISAFAVNVFAGDDPDGYRTLTTTGTITDIENVTGTAGTSSTSYDAMTLLNHGFKTTYNQSSITFADADTDLYFKSQTSNDLSSYTTSAAVLIQSAVTFSQDVTIENTLGDAALIVGWKGVVNVAAGTTMTLTGTLENGSSGGNLQIYDKANSTSMTNNGTLIVEGYLEMVAASTIQTTFTNNGVMTVGGTTTIASGKFNLGSASTSTFTGATTISGGTTTINSGADVDFAAKVLMYGGTLNISSSTVDFESFVTLYGGTLNLLSGSEFDIFTSNISASSYNRISILGSSDATTTPTINILDADILSNKELYISSNTLTLGFSTGSVTVADDTNISIGTVTLVNSSSELVIDMSSLADSTGVTISIGDISVSSTDTTITIDGFLNDILQISELADTSYDIVGEITDGVAYATVTIDGYSVNLSVDVGDLEGNEFIFDSNGFLSFGGVVVPEPSTYAMIFGAIALGLAVYRRRK